MYISPVEILENATDTRAETYSGTCSIFTLNIKAKLKNFFLTVMSGFSLTSVEVNIFFSFQNDKTSVNLYIQNQFWQILLCVRGREMYFWFYGGNPFVYLYSRRILWDLGLLYIYISMDPREKVPNEICLGFQGKTPFYVFSNNFNKLQYSYNQ